MSSLDLESQTRLLARQDELVCTYAALILHDDGAEITPAAMTNLIKD